MNPSLHTGAQVWEVAKKISSRPASSGRAGAPADPISRSSPSGNAPTEFAPQNTTASLPWLMHESSTGSELHSSTLISVPEHFKLFTATGDPVAPHQLPPPYWPHGEGLSTPKSKPNCLQATLAASAFIPHTDPKDPELVCTSSNPELAG